MLSNVDQDLLQKAKELGKHASESDAVNAALREYIDKLRRLQILELAGTIDYDPDYDYKAMRRYEKEKALRRDWPEE